MKKIAKIKKKVNNYFYDHYRLKTVIDYAFVTFMSLLSAVFYSFAFYCFISPYTGPGASENTYTMITGGVGGISQVITLILQACGATLDAKKFHAIFYAALNVPICLFAFFKIGKKFTIFTILNVIASSILLTVFEDTPAIKNVLDEIAKDLQGDYLARVALGAFMIGLSSSVAYMVDISAGGMDVVGYYFALKKSTGVGKISMAINISIITIYSILNVTIGGGSLAHGLLTFGLGVIYLVTIALVIDSINLRNRKIKVDIITHRDDMATILIANFPHGATVVDAKGGYSKTNEYDVHMIVSSKEVSKVVSLAKKVDPKSFIYVTKLVQVYGNFFIKPVE